jgi:hypothetical protein
VELVEPAKYNHSFSSIKTFVEICELRYAHEKLAPWEDTDASRRGNQIHTALEHWAKLGLRDAAYQTVLCTPGILPYADLQSWLDRVKGFAQCLAPVESEFWIRTPLEGCARPLVGKVDLRAVHADYGEMLIDWKSVNSMRKKLTQTECDRSLQGRIYCKVTGVRRIGFVYFTENHEAELVTSEYSDKDLAEAWEFVCHTCRQIENRWKTGHWRKAFPGGLCSETWCPVFATCYGGAGARGPEQDVADGAA